MVVIDKIIDENIDQHELIIKGEIDASSSINLDEALRESMDKSKNILVDLSGLEYISSAGLGVFMSNIQKVESENINFILYGMKEKVLEVFQILGLDQLLVIKESKEEALIALR